MSAKQFAVPETKSSESAPDLVNKSLEGAVLATNGLVLIPKNIVVSSNSFNKDNLDKVTCISGGGSGHEPTHSGFVGQGMLDAVAVGQIFASPSAKQVRQAMKAVKSSKGTLVIVKNYTGDVLHFGLAVEKQKTETDCRMLIVGDDVSVPRSQGKLVGRRGLAGIAIVHKIAGAAAESGCDLETVYKHSSNVAQNLASIAISLDHSNVPGTKFESNIKADEYELGLGIHNEPGVFRGSPIPTIDEAVDAMLAKILDMEDKERAFVKFSKGDEILLMVNNLGGISPFELSYALAAAQKKLGDYKVVRVVHGTLTTAFNGPGFSITLLNLTNCNDSKILELIDAPTDASGWIKPVIPNTDGTSNDFKIDVKDAGEELDESTCSSITISKDTLAKIASGMKNVISAEPEITRYDTVAGDGDCGTTLKAGAEAILKLLENSEQLASQSAAKTVLMFADTVEDAMGGTSGALYSIFLAAYGSALQKCGEDADAFKTSAEKALETLYDYTKARVGDRTLIDALDPFITNLQNGVASALKASSEGVDRTSKLAAKAGRAAYVEQTELAKEDVPDPGAYGLLKILEGTFASAK